MNDAMALDKGQKGCGMSHKTESHNETFKS
jgi:hypothetical protein